MIASGDTRFEAPAGERIRAAQDALKGAMPATGQQTVGTAPTVFQIERLAEDGIALWLGGAPAAVVPGAEDAAWIARLVESVDDERGQRLMLAGIVAGIALANGAAP